MSDLIERLRATDRTIAAARVRPLMAQAADEIERLTADRDTLLDALEYAQPIINGLFKGELPECFKPSVEVVNVINRALHEAKG